MAKCSFNRTFMELKFEKFREKYKDLQVLIVPLWNWNLTSVSLNRSIVSFNRTFMELK